MTRKISHDAECSRNVSSWENVLVCQLSMYISLLVFVVICRSCKADKMKLFCSTIFFGNNTSPFIDADKHRLQRTAHIYTSSE